MSKKSISFWMYLCISPRYFRTKCHSESLIPSLVHKVWKVLVNSGTIVPSLAIVWSMSCTGPHSFQQGNNVPLPHPQTNPKWDQPRIFQIPLWNFAPSKFPTNFWHGEDLYEVRRWSFLCAKNCEQRNNLLTDLTICLGNPHLSNLQIWEYQNWLVPWKERFLQSYYLMNMHWFYQHTLKDVHKILHHSIPLSRDSFL